MVPVPFSREQTTRRVEDGLGRDVFGNISLTQEGFGLTADTDADAPRKTASCQKRKAPTKRAAHDGARKEKVDLPLHPAPAACSGNARSK